MPQYYYGTDNGETLSGGNTDDYVYGYGGNDRLYGGPGFDVVFGGEGADELHTGSGSGDFLYGGPGDDVLYGEATYNYYFFTGKDDGYDTIVGGAGTDGVFATRNNTAISLKAFSGVEYFSNNTYSGVSIRGTGGAEYFDFRSVGMIGITLIDGGAGNDTILGSAQGDTIMGGGGNDTLSGFLGDDIFVVGRGDGVDRFDGDGGFDIIRADADSVVIGISALTGVERIDGGGFANVSIAMTASGDFLNLNGVEVSGIARISLGAGQDVFYGSASGDVIIGGAGDDLLFGNGGDDTFEVAAGAGSDTIDGGDGVDTIKVTAATFAWTGISNVEALVGTNLKLTGTSGADVIDLRLVDVTGVTKVWAGLGDDEVLTGGSGGRFDLSDGQDYFFSGAGADRFELARIADSKVGAADTISGFAQGSDLIDLSAVDASTKAAGNQAFTFIGDAAFGGVAGELRYAAQTTDIFGDVNGDRIADFQIHLTSPLALTAADFLL
jgi:Ca2+-binding RTX toxin-like protein